MSPRTASRRIALVNPLGDLGISAHTHELANALAATGAVVDVFGSDVHRADGFAKAYRLYPVIGTSWGKRVLLGHRREPGPFSVTGVDLVASADRLQSQAQWRVVLRDKFLAGELALALRARRYDIVWTQWPHMFHAGDFWRLARLLGMRVVHTVHNVLPHELREGDQQICGQVYRLSDVLVVHNEYAKAALAASFPGAERRVLVAPIGGYTIYPRCPEQREAVRARLGVAAHQPLILLFGQQRPYKNPDAVVQAFAQVRHRDPVLVVAGEEAHFADADPRDPLGRIRRQADTLGVAQRIRFLPGLPDHADVPGLFEAADIVPLPYIESYGSAQLVLAMQFGKIVLATAVGGMEEYLNGSEHAILLRGPEPEHVVAGLECALRKLESHDAEKCASENLERFDWRRIASQLLARIEEI